MKKYIHLNCDSVVPKIYLDYKIPVTTGRFKLQISCITKQLRNLLGHQAMEYDCHIFSKDLVFQMKNQVFQSKCLVFRSKTLDFDQNARYFDSEIQKYQVFCTLNLKYQVFRANTQYFKKGVKSRLFSRLYVCPLVSASVVPTTDTQILSKYYTFVQLDQQQKIWHHLLILFPIQRTRVVR